MALTISVCLGKQTVKRNEYRLEKTCFKHMQNKGADQLPGNHAADQRLCFPYIDSIIPLFPKFQASGWSARFVRNLKDRISRVATQLTTVLVKFWF